MAIQTFEYCSLHYLNQWLTYDRGYCQALSEDDEDNKLVALGSAGAFYGVARNLPKEFDEYDEYAEKKRYQPVLEILDEVDQNQFQVNPVKKILEIEKKISREYGNRNVLSLTTKFLWLKVKQPILIYDSQARIALKTKKGDLDAYYEKWQEAFEEYQNQVNNACSKLPDLHLYAVDQEEGIKEYIEDVSPEPWFHERVFDIYLWSKGNNA